VRAYRLTALAAAMLALGACDQVGIGGGGGGSGASEAAPQIAAADIQAAVEDPRVRRFYEARQWQPVWSGAAEEQLTQALNESPRHGLDRQRVQNGIGGEPGSAAREASLTLAAINYAEALARGATDPKRSHEVYELPRPEVDVAGGLAGAVEAGNVGEWLNGLAPQDAEYKALSDAYVRYAEAASQQQAAPIPPGDSIHPGDNDPRVPAIAAALRAHGYLSTPQPPAEGQQAQPQQAQAGTAFTPELAAAVRRVQQDYGMEPDGVVGNGTLDVLNATARDRARALAVNLERRRWLPRTAPETRIDVNTASAMLDYWRDGRLANTRRVMVGQPGWETPALLSPMVRLVANPPWTVPSSIEEEELAPKGAAYLARNGFTRRNGRLVQRPGPDSALGLVKFDMQNSHAIYLHDTPAKAGFQRDERHMSHGCVRVHDAVGFATMLAEHDGQRAQFERALQREGQEGAINLKKEIPVRLLYHTPSSRATACCSAPTLMAGTSRWRRSSASPPANGNC